MSKKQRIYRSYRLPADHSGSSSDEPLYLAVGQLRRPHGVRGEIRMEVFTDFPERLAAGRTVFVGPRRMPLQIRSVRQHNDALLVSFEGYNDRDQVGLLRNMVVAVPAEEAPSLPEGEFYYHQILGLKVVTDEGETLGRVAEIMETGANDVFVVQAEDGRAEILLPDTEEVVLEIDPEAGIMRVHLLPGLREA
ncbi:MAG: 16S rRNA processing protein RimM [Chloroflexi bacterium]|nr:16S rRNA processing protein RimM [Chloroflexota bacterium]